MQTLRLSMMTTKTKINPHLLYNNLTHQLNNTKNMKDVKIQPLGDRVLVKSIEESEQVRGGIIIPDSAKEKPQEAEVIALGTGRRGDDGKVIAFSVKVGDRVLTSKYGGTEVKYNDKTYTIVREDDILGVINK